MTRSRPITLLAGAAVIPLIALALAACGGGAATASPPPAPSKTTTTPKQTTTIRVANSSLGRILVDSAGRTLYPFKADAGTRSACSGACAIAWPPLRTGGTPAVAGGASAVLVGTIERSDGVWQATYNGHLLYTFVKDKKRGDVQRAGSVCVRGCLVRGFSRRQRNLEPVRGAQQQLIVVAAIQVCRPARPEPPPGSEARAGRCGAGAARCEARAASQRHPPEQRW